MINQLIINGCSYNEVYAQGPGPKKLAESLGIENRHSLALGGSANSRILRTTLKHSYSIDAPAFYLVGLTFTSRWELPVLETREFEGKWVNPQAQCTASQQFQFNWTDRDTELFKELSFKSVVYGDVDLFEDLVYRCLGMISDLHRRGHRVLIYNNCNEYFADLVDNDPKFSIVKNNPVFVDGLKWIAIPWQHQQGALPVPYRNNPATIPPNNLKHIHPQDYRFKNEYLLNYIRQHKILE